MRTLIRNWILSIRYMSRWHQRSICWVVGSLWTAQYLVEVMSGPWTFKGFDGRRVHQGNWRRNTSCVGTSSFPKFARRLISPFLAFFPISKTKLRDRVRVGLSMVTDAHTRVTHLLPKLAASRLQGSCHFAGDAVISMWMAASLSKRPRCFVAFRLPRLLL